MMAGNKEVQTSLDQRCSFPWNRKGIEREVPRSPKKRRTPRITPESVNKLKTKFVK